MILWTAGPYDLVAVTDVPDEETGTAINLQLGATGNLRTITMRGFTEDEWREPSRRWTKQTTSA